MIFVPVLGMHRSGTSLVAGIIRRLGIYMGDDEDMIPTDVLNPRGYNELFLAVRTNDDLLEMMHATWRRPPAVRLAEGWKARFLKKQSRASFFMRTVLKYLMWGADRHELPGFGLKDPRLLLTMHIWLRKIPDKTKVKTIVVCRNREAILKSWIAAHRLNPKEAKRSYGVYMRWLQYQIKKDKPDCCVVIYEQLLKEPKKEVARIMKFLYGYTEDDLVAHAAALVEPNLNKPGSKKKKTKEELKKEAEKKAAALKKETQKKKGKK